MANVTKARRAGSPPPTAMTKTKVLRQKPLVGMEQVRHVTLDRLCESIGDSREQSNTLRQNTAADIQVALDYMLDPTNKVRAYHHAGTELVVRPGAAKLSVRPHKEPTAVTTMPGDEAL